MRIKTPSDELNRALGGGIPVDKITMFYGDPGVAETRMMSDFACHVADFGPMQRTMFSYNCAVIVRIMNQRGIVNLHVEKNRYGANGFFMRYRHPDDVPTVEVRIETKDIDPNRVKHKLKSNWSFGSDEKNGDVDRSGETYNPYTGKWRFL